MYQEVKGAFDQEAHNRLLAVLQQLGFPLSLISWTLAFLTERLLRLSFDGQIEAFRQIAAGIPQGSPVSPILFLIYIHSLFGSISNFTLSYMDDVAISASSTSLRKNVRMLERDVATLFGLGVPCAIQFDIAKTELIHFTTGKESLAATLTLPDQTVVTPKPVVKWLGIHLDNALSFKEHVSIRTSQAQSAFYRMCRLANSERGLSPYALRQLYMACVTSVADYGCQVYWKGQTLVTSKLQGLQNMALRKILGTFRTSPTLPSEVEAALPPPAIRLNTALRQYAFRARKLPDRHPIKEATQFIESQLYSQHHSDSEYDSDASDQSDYTRKMLEGPPRQLQQIVQSIHSALSTPEEQLIPHSFRPWQRQAPYNTVLSKLSKEEEAQAHTAYMSTRMGDSLLAIYSDASSVQDGTGIGVGVVAFDYSQQAREVFSQTLNIGEGQIVYNGELEGITLAFEYAATVALSFQEIRIHADNQAALYRLRTPSDKPAQVWQLRCIRAANQVIQKGAAISLHWVPGHKDVAGNEKADSLAKLAAKEPPSSDITSLAMTGIKIKQIGTREWQQVLAKYTPNAIHRNPNTYASKYSWKTRKKLSVPTGTRREIASAFYQLKIGHGYNKAYLFRMGKADSPLCSCGAKQSPDHLLLSCKWFNKDRRILRQDLNNAPLTLPLLLHTKQGIQATLAFITRTRVCTRKWHLGQEPDADV
jgi:ribonuclease HI